MKKSLDYQKKDYGQAVCISGQIEPDSFTIHQLIEKIRFKEKLFGQARGNIYSTMSG